VPSEIDHVGLREFVRKRYDSEYAGPKKFGSETESSEMYRQLVEVPSLRTHLDDFLSHEGCMDRVLDAGCGDGRMIPILSGPCPREAGCIHLQRREAQLRSGRNQSPSPQGGDRLRGHLSRHLRVLHVLEIHVEGVWVSPPGGGFAGFQH